ncbi:MAG: leucine-rich repeat domain-containing protein [Lachnospiraceae bacterium]|nr:leucine-rich repeat domain-containing protein [Lachnospiraceae bacterium]MDD3616576.1 leucine-rich repeat domain-containing protein [Lachnospiraceae bacterium]
MRQEERRIINGRYAIQKEIQRGGFGTTYLAVDEMLGMPVAIKEYSGADSKRKQQFLKEARSLAKFSGEPGIVNVRDFLEEDGNAYMVMEYLEGQDLKTYIEESGPVSFTKALELMNPVINTVEKLHKAGFIHRDISPENIRMMPNGTVKLLDFGSAMDVEGEEGKTVTVMVKPGYAPREQYMNQSKQGPWTDVYGICATICKCITGNTPMDSLQRSFQDELPLPSVQGADITIPEEAVLMKGMAVDDQKRYRSVKELRQALLGNDKSIIDNAAGNMYESLEHKYIPDIKEDELNHNKSQKTAEKNDFPEREKQKTIAKKSDREIDRESETKSNKESNKESDTKSDKKLDKKYRKAANKKAANKKAANRKAGKKTGKTTIAKRILLTFAVFAAVIIAVVMYTSNPYREKDSNASFIKEKTITKSIVRKVNRDSKTTYLDLYKCEISDDVMEEIGKMKHIDEIRLDSCSGYKSLEPLTAMKNLAEISYEGADNCDGNTLFEGDFSKIEKLTFVSCKFTEEPAFLKEFTGLQSIYIGGCEGIYKVDFVESMPNLSKLYLNDMDLSGDTIQPLKSCTNLLTVYAENSGMSDVSWISSSKSLEEVHLQGNSITDINSLSGCKEITWLDLENNEITDISALAGMEKLQVVYLSGNQITDIQALQNKNTITSLEMGSNQISDLTPLQGAENLNLLNVQNNNIQDLTPIAACTQLGTLNIAGNQVSDLSPISNCTEMVNLNISKNQIGNLNACERMINLKNIYAADNQITDISKLANSTLIKAMELQNNQITDTSALEGRFADLYTLNISDNQISSLKMVSASSGLLSLIADHNQITSLEGLEQKTSLKTILLYDNQISDIAPLSASLGKVLYMDLGKNQITDISTLSKLTVSKIYLFLENNQITDISVLPTAVDYQDLVLYGNPIQDLSVIGNFENVKPMYSSLYISHQENLDYQPLAGTDYNDKLHLIDVPLDMQAQLQNTLAEGKALFMPEALFMTNEEADTAMDQYRTKLMEIINGDLDTALAGLSSVQ